MYLFLCLPQSLLLSFHYKIHCFSKFYVRSPLCVLRDHGVPDLVDRNVAFFIEVFEIRQRQELGISSFRVLCVFWWCGIICRKGCDNVSTFRCPFCGSSTSLSKENYWSTTECFGGALKYGGSYSGPINPFVYLEIFRCANEDCKKETIRITGKNGAMEDKSLFVYPRAVYRHFPEYIPENIRQDYEEACQIKDQSPKAAATLARRCLQGMIRDYWQITENTLYKEISQLQGKIPAQQWTAIDALRKIGNIGAHMEKDTSLIVDISPGEADQLLQLVELLMDKWYIARHDEEELCKRIVSTNDSLQAARQQNQQVPQPPTSQDP